jgi:hypothetical protein
MFGTRTIWQPWSPANYRPKPTLKKNDTYSQQLLLPHLKAEAFSKNLCRRSGLPDGSFSI